VFLTPACPLCPRASRSQPQFPQFGCPVSLAAPGGLTVHGQVDGFTAADADRVPHLALVGSRLLPANAVPGHPPAVGGQAKADRDGQGIAIEEPADLGRAGAATREAQGVSTLHQLRVVGCDRGLGQDLCGSERHGAGAGHHLLGGPPILRQDLDGGTRLGWGIKNGYRRQVQSWKPS
jgi:hypothetical protein